MTSTTSSTTGSRASAARAPERPRAERDTSRLSSLPVIGKLESPLTTYYLILGAMTTLVVFGLIMVFSASSVSSLLGGQASYSVFARQALFALIGAVFAAAASRMPLAWWKRLSLPTFVASVMLLGLVFVPSLGVEVNGNRNWLRLGPVQLQPSEVGKLALVLVGAMVFANKGRLVGLMRHAILPYLIPVSVIILALVLGGDDLGTALVMLAIIGAVLAVAGVRGRFFLLSGAIGAVGVAYLVHSSGNRVARIANFLSPSCQSDPDGWCGQSVHGMYALADGGWWGVGLGASKEKWDWLAEAHNDFIFAIIGEELGLPGTLVILFLFAIIAWGCYRLMVRTRDRFVRIATAGIMAWLLGQAIVNIGAVIGLLPVIGVPLPLVSAGGSSLVTTMLALGMLLCFARNEPGCRALLAARPGMLKRSLAVMPTRSPLRRNR
ncbi:MAG: putative lipid II flippase FtsW [Intrasporangium sp.]|uniref:putative lipid II flippase FtsW n=1 Tax=Intrasporangium sp. TaxID=1925024 RepID=UPI003F7E1980